MGHVDSSETKARQLKSSQVEKWWIADNYKASINAESAIAKYMSFLDMDYEFLRI